jgi:hypothetical protein
MKSETYNQPLSASTISVLSTLLNNLLHQRERDPMDEAVYRSVGMVLATPIVGVLAKAESARSALREEMSFLKMDSQNRLYPSDARTALLRRYNDIDNDIEFGRNQRP